MAIKKGSGMDMMCHHGECGRCRSAKLVVLGVLVLVNQVWGLVPWGSFVGGLLVLWGLAKLAMPCCPHCK